MAELPITQFEVDLAHKTRSKIAFEGNGEIASLRRLVLLCNTLDTVCERMSNLYQSNAILPEVHKNDTDSVESEAHEDDAESVESEEYDDPDSWNSEVHEDDMASFNLTSVLVEESLRIDEQRPPPSLRKEPNVTVYSVSDDDSDLDDQSESSSSDGFWSSEDEYDSDDSSAHDDGEEDDFLTPYDQRHQHFNVSSDLLCKSTVEHIEDLWDLVSNPVTRK
ncbi:hypothetical protein NA57DRAFT_57123 [Rhizodiscina lignyota]|uniref:Uncharacterized protein n=1 Tax=Rhizodiscina lignyota TaxID=1504668 RepID=A0A9P4IGU3_9PEZI|nr:hypothetical protein NA57DRAFT_57123 [Rhizodiscina lignyota]